jgi:hypothetical protein
MHVADEFKSPSLGRLLLLGATLLLPLLKCAHALVMHALHFTDSLPAFVGDRQHIRSLSQC